MKLFLTRLLLAATHGVVEVVKVTVCQQLPLSTSPMATGRRNVKRAGDSHCLQTLCLRGQITRQIRLIIDTTPPRQIVKLFKNWKKFLNKVMPKNQQNSRTIKLKFVY